MLMKEFVLEDGGRQVDFLPLVVKLTAKNWQWNGNAGTVSFEDAVAESVLAVLQVRKRTNQKRARLITYAYRRIIGATQDLSRIESRYITRFVATDPTTFTGRLESGASPGFERELSNKILFARVIQAMRRTLSSQEILVISRTFFHERKDAEIAREFALPLHHVSKLRTGALARIRSQFGSGRFIA